VCRSLPLSVFLVAMFLLSCRFPYPQKRRGPGGGQQRRGGGGGGGGVHKLVPTRCPIRTYQVPHLRTTSSSISLVFLELNQSLINF
jgi:hypothetical protein